MPVAGGGDGYRPVVAVDVDGVLRLHGRTAADPNSFGAFTAEVTVHCEAYPHVFHSPPMWDDDGVSTKRDLFSGVGPAWVRSLLHRGVDVVWATTWQEHANTYFAPILGVPPLPVAVRGDEEDEWGPAEWKRVRLAAGFPGRPLLWVDDTPPVRAGYELDALRKPNDRALTLMQWIRDPAVGITPADVSEMDEWLMLASTEDGQRELRRRRKREREYRRGESDWLHYGTRARGRRARRMRAVLFDAILDSGYGAPENIARYWLGDEHDVDAIVNTAAELARAAAASAADARRSAEHPQGAPRDGEGEAL